MVSAVQTYDKERIWEILKEVIDPEIPVLNIVEMGIARNVEVQEGKIMIKITPTYSGCPAMIAIEKEIRLMLVQHKIENFEIKKDFSETWTTDWLTNEAKQKLKEYGIAPPDKTKPENLFTSFSDSKIIPCPYCNSLNTELQSEFGSTACKAQYYCHNCDEPFEHFKCI